MVKFILKTVLFLLAVCTISVAKGQRWQIFDRMPYPVAGAEVVVYEDKIFFFGGYEEENGPPIDKIQVYNPKECVQQRWSLAGRMQIPRSNFVARLHDHTVYMVGGTTGYGRENVSSMETWNFKGGGKSLPEDIVLNRTGSTGEIWNDYFIIIGGYNNTRPDNSMGYLVAYNLDRGESLQFLGHFGLEPYNQASVLVGDDIYVFGGVRAGISNRIYKIELNQLDWENSPPVLSAIPRIYPELPMPLSAMEAVQTDPDTVFLIGGYNEDHRALRSTSKFVIKSKNSGYEHMKAPSLNFARRESMAAKLDTVVYVFGGVGEHGQVLGSVEALIDTVIVDSCGNTDVVKFAIDDLSYILKQNYPNPFNASTTIEFELRGREKVRLDIYSSHGRFIKNLVFEELPAGRFRYVWDGTLFNGQPVPSGVYMYKLSTNTETETRKMLLVK